ERGIRPRGRRDLRHEAVYLFGAVCPERDHGVALILPAVSTAAMQSMLDELATAVTPGAHAVVILDRAGWHAANELKLPAHLTPVFLPPSPPERPTTASPTPAAPPGTHFAANPAASARFARSSGCHRSKVNGIGISR